MKVKTSELSGHALDWAVAKCEEELDGRLTVFRREDFVGRPVERETEPGSYKYEWWAPSRICAQGGPIIDRERISTVLKHHGWWFACVYDVNDEPQYGQTADARLTAAMRCRVAARLGDEVDVPEELL